MNALCRSSIAELAGTLTLTFIGAGTMISTMTDSGGNLVAIALAHGLALAMAIYASLDPVAHKPAIDKMADRIVVTRYDIDAYGHAR